MNTHGGLLLRVVTPLENWTKPMHICSRVNEESSSSAVTHQTRLIQWTWNILSIQDYPGVSDECDPHSSHPLHENWPRQRRIPKEMTILRRAMTTWHLTDIPPLRMSQEAEETKEKWKRKVQITFLAPSVKFRCPMLAFWTFWISHPFLELSSTWLYHHEA